MTVDHDGKIRMDCSSPYAMARLVGLKDQYQRRLRQRSRRRPARHRHAVGGLAESQSLSGRRHPVSARPTPSNGRRMCRSARHWFSSSMIDRVVASLAGSCARCRSASNGSCLDCLTARIASAARKAPARASCAATEPCGPPTKTARSWICWPPRSPPGPARIPASIIANLTAEFGSPLYTRIDAAATRRAEGAG